MKEPEHTPPVPYSTHVEGGCGVEIRMTPAEVRAVNETPGADWWWEDRHVDADHASESCPLKHLDRKYRDENHHRYCYPKPTTASKTTVQCELHHGHAGKHMVMVGEVGSDLSKNLVLSWITGDRGSRELDQPGLCEAVAPDDSDDSDDFCVLPKGHGGHHYLQMSLWNVT